MTNFRFSKLLDTQFNGPFNIKLGLDSIIGLVPGWGDQVSFLLSHYIIFRSVTLRCSSMVLVQMIINTYIDFILGSVPVFGDVFDLYWKSNAKNAILLEHYLQQPRKTESSSLIAVTLIISSMIIGIVLFTYLIFKLLNLILS